MAQPIYSTSVNIDSFRGLNQTGDGTNIDLRYAVETENVNFHNGTYSPMREGAMIEQTLDNPIGTLAYLHRRFGATGVAGTTLLVAISNGKLYTKILDGDDSWVQKYPLLTAVEESEEEEPVEESEEEPVEVPGFTNNDCDWVTYEISAYKDYDEEKTYGIGDRVLHTEEEEEGGETVEVTKAYKCIEAITEPEAWDATHWTEMGSNDPVDILLFSNAEDGMFCLYGDDQSVVPVATPKKFGVIARYNERIWGAGITSDPDMLVYSAPFDPFDWDQNEEIPEDGAGDIQQPTWDGDSFLSLRQIGSDLIAIKRNSVWRIYGTNPGEFVMTQQYGGGTIEENTVAVYNEYAYMLGEHGMLRYDGTGAYPFLQDVVQKLMSEKANHDYFSRCCAAMRNGIYCLALPINGSQFCNAILEYDTGENTFALRTEVSVNSFMQFNERLFYTSDTYPGVIYELRDDKGKVKTSRWVSGYQDLGLKNSIKSAFILYAMIDSEAPVELRIGMRTEKKLKQKIVNTKPGKMLRLHLNTQGREFRLEITSYSAVPFTIAGGIKIDLELDPD